MNTSRNLTRDEVVKAAQKAAATIDGHLTQRDFTRITGISKDRIAFLFPSGGYSELLSAAGLTMHPAGSRPDRENLLIRFDTLAKSLGRIPTHGMMKAGGLPPSTMNRKFGSRDIYLLEYAEYLRLHDPDSKLLRELELLDSTSLPITSIPSNPHGPNVQHVHTVNSRITGTVYGAPINFRGLQHAPVNELGVVHLFGMISFELGFLVEAVQAAFPDCEAKRLVDSKKGLWQRVRIEFEFQSRSFRDHGHDPNFCDLIVCWEHNWPDCPLEVIELRESIKQLRSSIP